MTSTKFVAECKKICPRVEDTPCYSLIPSDNQSYIDHLAFATANLPKHRPDLLFGIAEARPEPPTGVRSPRVGLMILRVSQLVLG